ncbi:MULTISPECIES: hypothetical protein [Halobacterium]|uniref:hypothetical protein n=1 Tax=Halobacterium TaxID=2239 RepID=UPI00073E8550|nr:MULTISPECIES: hypothetical protein [Halobacterium]MCG1002665.1 hypothetical protein [Halobacterium noricense]
MSLRDAIDQTGWLPVAALLVLLWTIVTGIEVVNLAEAYSGVTGPYVGQTFVGGALGLLVLLGFAAAVVYVYDEAGESEPAPESFPPQ